MDSAWGFVRAMLERRDDPYEGADPSSSLRITAALLGLSALLALAFLPLDPVDEQIGWAGWPLAGATVAAGLVGAPLIARHPPGWNGLLAVAYIGVAGIALLNWLAGGGSSAYEDLLVLWVGAGVIHPPRRALTHLAVALGALSLPLLYEGTSATIALDMAAEALLLLVVGLVMIPYIFYLRRQRVGLRAGVELARRLARVDTLTGLGNRRAFDEALTIELARATRDERPLSVGLVDLDHLKEINDRHGHLEGDRCLREVANTMERSMRLSDRCFRWGGDEFVVILPNTDHRSAAQVLGRMAEEVGRVCEVVDGSTVALSWGVGEFEPDASPEDLLALADASLRDHKSEKRR
jgi:diguanylate cyclase (GGDEF)-like protein